MEYMSWAVTAYNTLKQIIKFLETQSKIHMRREIYDSRRVVFKSYETWFQSFCNNQSVSRPPKYSIWNFSGIENNDIKVFESVEIEYEEMEDIRSNMYTHFKSDEEIYQKDLFEDLVELLETYKTRCKIEIKIYLDREYESILNFDSEFGGKTRITARFYKLVYSLKRQ